MIELTDVRKVYNLAGAGVEALAGVSFAVDAGDFTALMGPSGSGKSTLMNILGCLDTPTSGDYLLGGVNVAKMTEDELSRVRNRDIGFVFQSYNLLARNTILENVCLPLYYRGELDPKSRAAAALEKVGLSHRLNHFPSQVSGGESQRTAIARAIVAEPKIILADEPTGNLDTKTGAAIMDILKSLNGDGVTIVMVTHDQAIAAHSRRIIKLKDGRLEDRQRA
ncbi:MAG: ABC transporter ATP-binding protein [Nitrospinae bacterium]|nr:ABC transporter ATP-binding protein [Nitrospinota bacterium]